MRFILFESFYLQILKRNLKLDYFVVQEFHLLFGAVFLKLLIILIKNEIIKFFTYCASLFPFPS